MIGGEYLLPLRPSMPDEATPWRRGGDGLRVNIRGKARTAGLKELRYTKEGVMSGFYQRGVR
jgi:hypothetical protein